MSGCLYSGQNCLVRPKTPQLDSGVPIGEKPRSWWAPTAFSRAKWYSSTPLESTDGEFFRKKEVVATIRKYADVFAGRKPDP